MIESAAGYKRILVGEGHEAARMQNSSNAGQPGNTYDAPEALVAAQGECYRPPCSSKAEAICMDSIRARSRCRWPLPLIRFPESEGPELGPDSVTFVRPSLVQAASGNG